MNKGKEIYKVFKFQAFELKRIVNIRIIKIENETDKKPLFTSYVAISKMDNK